jgi:hypothetical protein
MTPVLLTLTRIRVIAPVLLAQLLALPAAMAVPPAPRSGHRLTGVARYADGRVVPNCRVLVLHPAFDPLHETRCDTEGRYQLILDAGSYNAVAILDDGYGKTTLEFWAWNVRVGGDLVLDATIDRIEVYNLSLWNSKGGAPSLFIAFRPMSLDRVGAAPQPRIVEHDTLMVQDLSPALTRGQVRVTVDGTPAEVESLQWYFERYFDQTAGAHRYLPACLVQVARPRLAI